MQPRCLPDDAVVDQSTFDGGDDVVDVAFLLHEAEAIGEGD